LEASYYLNNGTMIHISSNRQGSKQFKKNTNFALVGQIDGKSVGYLIIENGLNLRNTYTGDLIMKIYPDYLGLGIEKIFFRKLNQWLFSQSNEIRKAKIKTQVDDLTVLELIMNINMIRNEEMENESIRVV